MMIAVTDSGIGGLWVLASLRKKFPHEEYIYYSDNRFQPYGIRNSDFLKERFHAVSEELALMGVELTVVGCNTMSVTVGLKGGIETNMDSVWICPEAHPEREKTLIMATPLSERSDYIVSLKEKGARVLSDGALAGIIEGLYEGCGEGTSSSVLEKEAEKILKAEPLLSDGWEAVSLGCTHYIYFRKLIARLSGAERIYDGVSPAVLRAANHIENFRKLRGGRRENFVRRAPCGNGGVRFIFSGADESQKYGRIFSKIANGE